MKRFKNWKNGTAPLTKTSRKKRLRRRVWGISLFVVVLLAGLITGGLMAGYQIWKDMYEPLPEESVPVDTSSVSQEQKNVTFVGGRPPELNLVSPAAVPEEYQEQYTNILLIISDGEEQADLVLLTIDQVHEQIKLTSFLKELWVKIPELEIDHQLDMAYAGGGPKLAAQTIEQNFGVGIDRYIEIDFQKFPELIDQLGGVELTLSEAEADYINRHVDSPGKLDGAGTYNLSGQQALCHAQNRTTQVHDFDSVDRMRDVILATFQRVQTTSDMVCLGKLALDSTSMISTDIKLDELSKLLIGCLDYSRYDMFLYRLPDGEDYEKTILLSDGEEKQVLFIQDMDQVRERLQSFVYGDFYQSGVSQTEDVLYNP